MYKKDGVFNLVTERTNDESNNVKFDKINELKSIKYPSDVTNLEIINNFVTLNMKDKNGKLIQLQESDITKTANDEDGTLSISIDISKYLPTGFNESDYKKTFTYDGFLNSKGYEIKINDNATLQSNGFLDQYPSQVTLSNVLDKLVVLGPKFPTSSDQWDFITIPNDVDGSITISLASRNQFVPSNKKQVLTSMKIDGFKSVGNDFKNTFLFIGNGIFYALL